VNEIPENEKAQSRYIPSEVRERVFKRASYQCQYRGIDGRRCSSRTGLEIDHQRPFALYRSHDERFLRVACGRHNRFEAERVYGTEFIRRKIDTKKRRKDLDNRDIASDYLDNREACDTLHAGCGQ
jgi:5-methylcytosine-specific restriction endonuclease McrA